MTNSNASLEALKRDYLRRRLQKSAAPKSPVTASTPIPPADRGKPLALSWGQQRLWFIDQLDQAAGAAYNMSAALRMTGLLDRAVLRAALDRIVARHENLRTVFALTDGLPAQVVRPADTGFCLSEDIVAPAGAAGQAGHIEQVLAGEAGKHFDLARGPLIRGRLLCLSEQEHVLIVTQHHIISDAWSRGVFIKELSALYTAFSQGLPDPLPALPLQYADYAAWQRSWLGEEEQRRQAEFWRAHLQDAPPVIALPHDRPRPAVQSHAGAAFKFDIGAQLRERLRQLGHRYGATLFGVVLAGWSAVMARLSGQDDIVVGMPVANRQRSEVEGLTGFFVNTLALRVKLDEDPSVEQLLEQVRLNLIDAFKHQDLPFEQVVEALAPPRSPAHSPIFQVAVSMNNTPHGKELKLPGLVLSAIEMPQTTSHFDLALHLEDTGTEINGGISYATDLFDESTARRFVACFERVLEAMVADPAARVSELTLLGAQERKLLLEDFSGTARPYPKDQLVHRLFEEQAASRPDAPALLCGAQRLSYGELNRRANQLAHHLRGLGVGPDARVAICFERSVEMVVGMLAILKAGGAYVPLDPSYPADRLAYMLDDSAPCALVTSTELRARFAALALPVVALDAMRAELALQPESDPDPAGQSSSQLAYVIYTSGSTGAPKGVMVEHHNVLGLVINNPFVELGPGDCLAHCANPAFDASTWEIWGPLLNGARVQIVPQPVLLEAGAFGALLASGGVTVLFLTVGLFNEYADVLGPAFGRLNYLFVGGDRLDPRKMARVLNGGNAPPHLLNVYGPTETTTFATTYEIVSLTEDAASIPIGRPIANSRAYVLDRHFQPVPVGVAGEIYIGGSGVARGYLNRPDLSAERFVADPFSPQAGARMYRTGDLGRWLADGNIEYLGRNDFQVKIRGFRIELGEIEARLTACAGVQEAVVVAREEDGDKRLVAYLLAQDGAALEAAELRRELGRHLADYMVPSAFMTLDAFPLTSNGKLDRKALPAPSVEAVAARAYEAPQGEREEAIAAIWQQLLGLERVGRHDHFFELGGHSLMVIGMLEQLRQQGMTSDVRSVFDAPTVAGLAASMNDGQQQAAAVPPNRIPAGCTRITPDMLPLVDLNEDEIALIEARVPNGAANIQDIYPLAPVQAGILFHHMLHSEGDPYLLRTVLAFDSRARLDGFLGTLQQVIDRHDILRSAVLWTGLDQPVQVVFRHAPLPVEELALTGQEDALARVLAHSDPRRTRLDLERAPLLKAWVAVDPATGEHFMALLNHHLVCDHVTLELIVAEITLLLEGRGEDLPQALPYRNFIAQTLTIDRAAQEAYFRGQLGDVDEPTIPFGMLDVYGSGAQVREARMLIDDGLAQRVRELSRQHGVTPAVLFHVAWAQLVAQASGRDDVVFGTVLSGRLQGSEGADRVVGMFINTLPIRVRLANVSVRDAVAASYRSLTELLVHEQASLALAQRCSGVAAPMPLFTSLLNYRHSHAADAGADGLLGWQGVRIVERGERTNYALMMAIDDLGQGFALNAQCADVDPQRILDLMARATAVLAQALEQHPEQQIGSLDILPAAERHLVLDTFNLTACDYPQDQLVHSLFEAQASAQPGATALVCGTHGLSYGELNRRANQLAHYLRGLGVGPDARVAICLERSVEMVVGLLAILKAGGAYVPLDPSYPADRRAYMLQDSAPCALLTSLELKAGFVTAALPVLALDAMQAELAIQPGSDPQVPGLAPSHLAYVMYTSGSTGLPKGVMIEHGHVVNLVLWSKGHFSPQQLQRTLFSTSINFDLSVFELFVPLAVGTQVTLVKEILADDGGALEGVTLINTVPSAINALVQTGRVPASVRTVNVCGEPLKRAVVEKLFETTAVSTVVNFYGPTEATVYATMVSMSREQGFIPHIGRPLANYRIYVLDQQLQPVPLGVPGEIYIGGASVARGYFDRPELSAERFLADPFSGQAGARMYKTGDLGRWLADGNLEYLGRNDFQVKIRGFRIELGEIEARLATCSGVREALVVAREEDEGDKRLVAYLLAQEGAILDAADLRRELGQHLAEYMVPNAFVTLGAYPLTPNGKLDRKALPAPGLDAVIARTYAAPQGEREATIAAIWQELLGLERVGRDDHFFELGGHSLMAIQLIARIRHEFGVELPLRDLFEQATVAGLAALVAGGGARTPEPIVPADRSQALPLSWAQQRLWFLDRLDHAASAAYHMPAGLRLRGRLDKAALQATLDRIVARHEALRTRFVQVHGAPVQEIAPVNTGFALAERDLSALAGHEQEAAVARYSVDETSAPFDLAQGPLIRGLLLRLSEQEHILLVTQHHIVSDAWSIGVLVNEVRALYTAFTQGQPDPLPPLAIQYADYAQWQRRWLQGEALRRQLDFWTGQLAGAPALLELPLDRPRPAVRGHAGASVAVALPAGLGGQLRALGQRHGTTLFMTLLAGWSALLARLSGQADVVVGTPVANRQRSEIETLIGFFVNTLALRVNVEDDPSVAQLLARVKASTVAAYDHQDVPFEQVVEALRPARSTSHTPIFQVVLSLNNTPDSGELELPGLTLSGVPAARTTAQFDLNMSLTESGDRIEGELHYATDLFDRATVAATIDQWLRLLQAMADDAAMPVSRLPLLSGAERERIVHGFNPTAVGKPALMVHELFALQAARNLAAVALRCEGSQMTYGELDTRSNQLAHHLLALGLAPDDRVAICVERGFDMLVGVLGILKAGAAYVPLDPAYPADRLAYMLADSAPRAVLTLASCRAGLPDHGLPEVVLDHDTALLAAYPDSAPDARARGLGMHHLAYVIYTSGSTGMPKGVMVEHGNVARLLGATEAQFGFGETDVWTLFHSFAFDFSVWEIWGALAYGGRLVIVPALCARAPGQFYQLLCREGVTVLNQTPSAFRQLIAAQQDDPADHALRAVIFGGEALELHTLVPWIERNDPQRTQLINMYGITEITVHATSRVIGAADIAAGRGSLIGQALPDLRMYILDVHRQPVPVGVTGELYIGGAGVARGYLNRQELSAERFLADPFSGRADARMYKTGDLGRWLADGSVEYLGRNDFQVKIRGFRIELGEIEARLAACAGVREAVVIAREDGGDKRLVAYLLAQEGAALEAGELRRELGQHLADYMVPSAFVTLDAYPLTPNGKLDRNALPAPGLDAVAARAYEAPQGELEEAIAAIWRQLLGLERVGRHDHFFELGGHSLMVIGMLEQLRQRGVTSDVRSVFAAPTVAGLAASINDGQTQAAAVPPNLIPAGCQKITPDMLPLVALNGDDIALIESKVPQGAANIQDIYPLAPVQSGILFHHLLHSEGDPYLLRTVVGFDTRARLDGFIGAFQRVIERHDILRSAVLWTGLSQPVQVVLRDAPLPVEELAPAGQGDTLERLLAHSDPRRTRLDLERAPLLKAFVAIDPVSGEHYLSLLTHHLVCDHMTLDMIVGEIGLLLQGQAAALPQALPYRNFIAQTLATDPAEHEAYFRAQLGDVEEPTAPFGLLDVYGSGEQVREARMALDDGLARRVRELSRQHGVTPAVLFHVAWAQVVAQTSGRDDVVFGTVLSGRLQGSEGADRVLGMFINTLPIRVRLANVGVRDAVAANYRSLSELLVHEQASLALAQRCSGVAAPLPLFTSLLNYRHTNGESASAENVLAWQGVRLVEGGERTNYALTMSVDDLGQGFALTAQCVEVEPQRMLDFLAHAVEVLAQALERHPEQQLSTLGSLPGVERHQVIEAFNATACTYPRDRLVHGLFEEVARRQPEATALLFGERQLSYGALNRRANQLAHHLRGLGVGPDTLVAICLERSVEMVVGLLAVLKAGGAYVPLDPGYPAERLTYMLEDSAPRALLSHSGLRELTGAFTVPVLELDRLDAVLAALPDTNPEPGALRPDHLAYVIYTSGSTGLPKGVMIEHSGLLNYLHWAHRAYGPEGVVDSLVSSPVAFDATVTSIYLPLISGGAMRLIRDGAELAELGPALRQRSGLLVKITPAHLAALGGEFAAAGQVCPPQTFVIGGEALPVSTVRLWQQVSPLARLVNEYGPTETVVGCITYEAASVQPTEINVPIGKPIANTRIYILGEGLQPLPVGVPGEIYIGGAGVGRGYLNRPELSAERFLADPFVDAPGARMYKTGDLARWLPDGNIDYLGRNDFQVKIRGFRIELGEIEARLAACAGVREAVVVARDEGGSKRLVAYLLAQDAAALDASALRDELGQHLAEYMVPSAFVTLDAYPLTPNGKLDRKALPAPGLEAVVARAYEAPQGEREEAIAAIWQKLLGLERVGRHDHFFELGGHSLMVIGMLEQLRQQGMASDVRSVFAAPTVAGLAASMDGGQAGAVVVPPNRIPAGCDKITPDMLPLVALDEDEIALVESRVPQGAANIGDIYPLAPVQSGILFHHLLHSEGDPYLMRTVLGFDGRARLDGFLHAFQQVIDRHDILRTAVQWTGLGQAVQVVHRHAPLPVEELALAGHDDALARLLAHSDPRRTRLDLERAPLLKAYVAVDPASGEHYLALMNHHLVCDHVTLELVVAEIGLLLKGKAAELPQPLPYRNFIAQTLSTDPAEHEAYFRAQLGDVDEPTAPFGLLDVYGSGERVREASAEIDEGLARRVRELSRQHGVTPAVLFHVAWAQVVAQASGRDDVVFGTVLSGRLQGSEGADRVVGMFINTLPIRVRLADVSVREAVAASYRSLSELLVHEQASLALAQRCSGVAAPMPLFTSLLNYRHSNAAPASEENVLAWQGVRVVEGGERTNYALTMSVDDLGQGFSMTAQCADVDPQRLTALLAHAVEALAQALEQHPEQPAIALGVLPAAERQLVLEGFNDTARAYPQDQLVHGLFEQQAASQPDATALLCEDQQLSYGELNRRANQLAHHLRGLGVGPDVRVAICLERGVEMVVGLLAILKAGGAYVPLDPGYPADRLAYMLADCAPCAVLTTSGMQAGFATLALPVLALDAMQAELAVQPPSNPERDGLSPAHLAYVIYTSGSTGLPKGAMNQHGAVVNRLLWAQDEYHLRADDRVLQKTPFSFDVSVWEFFLPLLAGAQLVMARPGGHQDPGYLGEIIEQAGITMLHFVPSMLQVFLHEADVARCASLRRVLCSGEALPHALQMQFHASLPAVELHNLYGPTEAAIDVTAWRCAPGAHRGIVPIGRPIANTSIYVLDRRLQPVPLGVAGEIYIGGAGVGRGYLNRPELSAERFVADPFSGQAGARMYKTGDLGRWLADGNIEYLGRNDFQVKIRGFRIELGEIEARLAACAGVREAVVVAREEGGDKRLVAYLLAQDGATLDAAELRRELGQHLADYMVPSAFVTLDAYPLTPNGKLDRKALPAPGLDAVVARVYEAPRGEREEAIAAIWQQLLGLERVGRHDHFFELGGHSLMLIGMLEQLRQRGMTSDVRSVFAAPTVAGLAASMDDGPPQGVVVPPNRIPAGCGKITPDMLPLVALNEDEIAFIEGRVPRGAANIQDIYPLAPVQSGILFHHLLQSEGDPYLLRTVLGFDSRARLDGFLAALQLVIDRHDILRSAVLWSGLRQPVQVVFRAAPLAVDEVALADQGDVLERLLAYSDPRRSRLELERAPLLKACVALDPATGEHYLALLTHHLVCDHVTLELIIGEIGLLLKGQAAALPQALPYRNFIAQTLAADPAAQEAYFRAQLGDVDEPTVPFGLLDVYGSGEQVREARMALDDGLARRVRELSRQHGVTPAVLFHVAWAQVVAQASGRDDVVFGTVLSGRLQGSEGADRVVGMFINTLPIRVRLADVSVREAVAASYRSLSELLVHEQASLALAQRCSGVAAPMPLFTSLLNYRHSNAAPASEENVLAWQGMRLVEGGERTNYALTMSVDDLGQGFALTAQCADVDPQRLTALLAHAVEALAQALEQHPEQQAIALGVLPAAERQLVLEGFNDTARAYPQDQLVHGLFEQQAASQPDATALLCEDQQLSYGELNRRANQLAHHLRGLGVGPDARVAICLERGVEMVVGLLAILKAGGAYVPLDPGYPADRLAYMLADCAPCAVLTTSGMQAGFATLALPVLALDAMQAELAVQPPSNPERDGLSPAHLAYVIYTSGSTGLPKGAMNQHGAVVNRLLWAQDEYHLRADDRVLQKTPFSFDVSVWEFFLPLLAGAQLVMARPGGHQDPGYLGEIIEQAGITMLHFVPSMLQVFLHEADVARCASLRRVLCSGEALPHALQMQFHASLPAVELHNLYGPTEAAIDVTAWRCAPGAHRGIVPIGRPIANTSIYVLDRRLQPVPLGVAGEIYIGGAGVGRGYLNRPELSAERFVADPFSGQAGARMYKTGDLGRWLADGNIEYLGRNDFQVKIRGFRIELGEIEARLAACAGVREAVVVAREEGGDKRLVAYLLAQDGATLDAAELRRELGQHLADYMVPSAFVTLDAYPLTPNGKLDRKALPAPGLDAVVARVYEAPQGQREKAIAAIWQELLGLGQVGRDDNFFELGGHSLLAIQFVARVREEMQVEIGVRDLFGEPTLAGVAAVVTQKAIARFDTAAIEAIEDEMDGMSEEELRAWLEQQELEG